MPPIALFSVRQTHRLLQKLGQNKKDFPLHISVSSQTASMAYKYETRLFINNEVCYTDIVFEFCQLTFNQFVPGKAGQYFPAFNPASNEKICDVHEALEEDVDLAVDAARAAFTEWSSCSANERAVLLARLAQLVARDAQELAELDGQAMGKSVLPNRKDSLHRLIQNAQTGRAVEKNGYPCVCRRFQLLRWMCLSCLGRVEFEFRKFLECQCETALWDCWLDNTVECATH